MAKGKLFKATLKRGASYTLPGVGVFYRGESKVVDEEQFQKLQGTAAFDFKEVSGKDAEELDGVDVSPTGGEPASATEAPKAEKPKAKAKGKK